VKSGKTFSRISEELLVSNEKRTFVDSSTIGELSALAEGTTRGRIRLCVHLDNEESVHEMFIVHPRGAYVPPHKHLGKTESIFIISGECDYFIFDESGVIQERVKLSDYRSGRPFFYRQQEDTYHSLFIHSPELIFLEITKGPFRREDTVVASWAPQEANDVAIKKFLMRLKHWTMVDGVDSMDP